MHPTKFRLDISAGPPPGNDPNRPWPPERPWRASAGPAAVPKTAGSGEPRVGLLRLVEDPQHRPAAAGDSEGDALLAVVVVKLEHRSAVLDADGEPPLLLARFGEL